MVHKCYVFIPILTKEYLRYKDTKEDLRAVYNAPDTTVLPIYLENPEQILRSMPEKQRTWFATLPIFSMKETSEFMEMVNSTPECKECQYDPTQPSPIEQILQKAKEAHEILRNEEKAARLYRFAAELGNPQGQFTVGAMYASGYGVPKNTSKAIQWYTKAANQGYSKAFCNLGSTHENIMRNYTEAAEFYRKAAELGDMYGQFNLGRMYDDGIGVKQDYAKSFKWFKKSAEQGYVKAMHNVAVCYETGEGVPQDNSEATHWYRMAAEQGNDESTHNLAVMYIQGTCTEQDTTLLAKLFQENVELGDPAAHYCLGLMYKDGIGVEKDPAKAIEMFKYAKNNGFDEAAAQIKELRN